MEFNPDGSIKLTRAAPQPETPEEREERAQRSGRSSASSGLPPFLKEAALRKAADACSMCGFKKDRLYRTSNGKIGNTVLSVVRKDPELGCTFYDLTRKEDCASCVKEDKDSFARCLGNLMVVCLSCRTKLRKQSEF